MMRGDTGDARRSPAVTDIPSAGRVHGFGIAHFGWYALAGFVSGATIGTAIGNVVALLPRTSAGTLVGTATGATCGTVMGILFKSALGSSRGASRGSLARRESTSDPHAVDKGDSARRMIIEKDREGDDGPEAFLRACRDGNESDAQLLYEEANPSEAVVSEALMSAVTGGHERVVRWLITSCNAGVSLSDDSGRTPLMLASAEGQCGVIRILVGAGALINKVNPEDDYKTALVYACENGHTDAVRLLCDEYAEKKATTDGTETKIEGMEMGFKCAARKGHVRVMQWLVGHNPGLPDTRGKGALRAASISGWVEVVKWLLDKGVPVVDTGTKERGWTAFLYACRHGHTEVAKLLYAQSPGVIETTTTKTEEAALMLAAGSGHVETVRWLLDICKVDVHRKDARGWTALTFATQHGWAGVVEELFAHMEDAAGEINRAEDEEGKTLFLRAAYEGHTEVIRLFLYTDPTLRGLHQRSGDGWSPLMLACREGHTDTAKLLLDCGAPPDDTDQRAGGITALTVAAENGHVGIVELLIGHGAEPDPTYPPGQNSPMILAAQNGHTEVVRFLRNRGADLTRTGHFGCTARKRAKANHRRNTLQLIDDLLVDIPVDKGGAEKLRGASRIGDLKTIREALTKGKGIDVNAADPDTGTTALILAAENGHIEAVRQLVDPPFEADITLSDRQGRTPLMFAARKGYRDIVELFANMGGSTLILRRSHKGWTALTCAVRGRRREIVELLISKIHNVPGASHGLSCADISGMTPLMLAVGKDEQIVERLLDVVPKERLSYRSAFGGWTACMFAVSLPDTLKLFLRAGVSEDDKNSTLILAAKGGCEESVRLLIKYGADVNCGDAEKNTPAILAASGGHDAIVRLLFASGADLTRGNRLGQTAWESAKICHRNQTATLIRTLLDSPKELPPQKEEAT